MAPAEVINRAGGSGQLKFRVKYKLHPSSSAEEEKEDIVLRSWRIEEIEAWFGVLFPDLTYVSAEQIK